MGMDLTTENYFEVFDEELKGKVHQVHKDNSKRSQEQQEALRKHNIKSVWREQKQWAIEFINEPDKLPKGFRKNRFGFISLDLKSKEGKLIEKELFNPPTPKSKFCTGAYLKGKGIIEDAQVVGLYQGRSALLFPSAFLVKDRLFVSIPKKIKILDSNYLSKADLNFLHQVFEGEVA